MDWIRRFSLVKRTNFGFGLLAAFAVLQLALLGFGGEAAGLADGGRMLAMVCSGGIVVCAAVAMVLITGSIKRSVRDTVDCVIQISQGDLETKIASPGRDEIAWLRAELNGMRKKLRQSVVSVRQTLGDVQSTSERIDVNNADLSSRTDDQTQALESTQANLGRLAESVERNAGHAVEARQLAASASAVARSGADTMVHVVERMKEIHQSSARVAEIVGVIDGIAFQTNILALNAAVEAARAGEQGRGFAVVAAEVRSLAQRSATAAREIKALIEESTARVAAGSQQVDGAGRTMQEIVSGVSRVDQLMGAMAEDGQTQRSGIGELGQAVRAIDEMTRQNQALVQQLGAATGELRGQAQELGAAMKVFQVQL